MFPIIDDASISWTNLQLDTFQLFIRFARTDILTESGQLSADAHHAGAGDLSITATVELTSDGSIQSQWR